MTRQINEQMVIVGEHNAQLVLEQEAADARSQRIQELSRNISGVTIAPLVHKSLGRHLDRLVYRNDIYREYNRKVSSVNKIIHTGEVANLLGKVVFAPSVFTGFYAGLFTFIDVMERASNDPLMSEVVAYATWLTGLGSLAGLATGHYLMSLSPRLLQHRFEKSPTTLEAFVDDLSQLGTLSRQATETTGMLYDLPVCQSAASEVYRDLQDIERTLDSNGEKISALRQTGGELMGYFRTNPSA